jgi:GNAT superfamily N-acetyltransferase
MDLVVATVAQRPDLAPLLKDFPDVWPEFMLHDPVAPLYYDVAESQYPEFVLIAVDQTAPERAVARAYSVPFSWSAAQLPCGGWDQVILYAAADRAAGRVANVVSALEISVQPHARGRGLSAIMLNELRRSVARLGFDALVAPVRPSGKHTRPDVPMTEYARSLRADGLPIDPWLRVHVRAGGQIESIAPRSMTIPGTLAEWRGWTGLPFGVTGPVHVPQALVPVYCDVEHDHAVYVEPNVWVRHQL